MRNLQVSTDVFAAIWRERQEGEDSEDDILRRKFGLSPKRPVNGSARQGFYDARYNAHFPEGFEIFRVYKGAELRARAEEGKWRLLNTDASYPSLRDLSNATVGHENAWIGWSYLDAGGEKRPVSAMRDASKIGRHGSRRYPNDISDLA